MAKYDITAPDGGIYEIEAPDSASEEQVLNYFKSQFQGSQQAAQPQPQPQPEQKAGGFSRMLGLTARDLAPYGVAATAGGLIGAPIGGVGAIPGALAGLGAYGLTRFVGDPLVAGVNYLAGTEIPSPSQAVNAGLDSLFPSPETEGEKIYSSALQGVGDSLSFTGAGKTLAEYAAKPVLKKIGQALSSTPATDAALGGVGGAAFETARQAAPDNPFYHYAAGIGLPMALGGAANATKAFGNYIDNADVWSTFIKNNPDAGSQNILSKSGIVPKTRRESAAAQSAVNELSKKLQAEANFNPNNPSAINDALRQIETGEQLKTLPEQGPATKTGSPALSPGFDPTLGTITGNTGLIRMEKGIKDQSRMLDRSMQNRAAIDIETSQAMRPIGESPTYAQRFIDKLYGKKISDAQAARQIAAKASSQADETLAGTKADFAATGAESVAGEQSQIVRKALGEQKSAVTNEADALFAKVPQNIQIPVNQNSVKKANEIVKSFKGVAGGPPAAVVDYLENAKTSLKEGGMMSGTAQKNLSSLYEAAAAQPDGSNTQRLINELRDSLDADISSVESVSAPLREARDFWRNEFVPRYKSGASFDVIYKRGVGGKSAVDPSQTIGEYWSTPESVSQLVSALSGTKGQLSKEAETALSEWVVSQMSKSKGASPSAKRLEDFVRANDAKIKQMGPAAQKKVDDIISSMSAAEAGSSQAKAGLAKAETKLAEAEKMQQKSMTAKFSKVDDASDAVGKIMGGDNPITGMRRLIKTASLDKSGKSSEGVKNATKKWLENKLKNAGTSSDNSNIATQGNLDNWSASFASNAKMLKDGKIRKALETVFSKEELAVMDRLRKQADVANRINRQTGSGSPTAGLLQSQNAMEEFVLASSGTGKTQINNPIVTKSKQAYTFLEGFKAIVGRSIKSNKEQKFYQDLLIEAFLNPSTVGKELLKRKPANKLPYSDMLRRPAMIAWMRQWADDNQPEE